MSMLGTKNPDYNLFRDKKTPSDVITENVRTVQAYKDQTDINKLLAKHGAKQALSHIEVFGGEYGDFENIDLLEAHQRINRAEEIFQALPGELRREFGSAPTFLKFVNDPKNKDRLPEVFPELAKRGNQMKALNQAAQAAQGSAATETPPEAAPKPPDAPSGED